MTAAGCRREEGVDDPGGAVGIGMLAGDEPEVDIGLHDADQNVGQVFLGDGRIEAPCRGFPVDELADQAGQPGLEVGGPGRQQAQGQLAFAVQLLTGANRDEGRLFLVAAGTIDLIDDATLAAAAGAYGLPASSLGVYRANRPGASAGDVLAAVITDWFFAIPALRVAEARAGQGASTWAYRFDHPAPEDNHRLGACHGVEIPFVFGTISRDDVRPLLGDAPSQAVAGQMHQVWVDFITSGDPGWPAYDTSRRTTGLLADTITVADDPSASERACWDGIR